LSPPRSTPFPYTTLFRSARERPSGISLLRRRGRSSFPKSSSSPLVLPRAEALRCARSLPSFCSCLLSCSPPLPQTLPSPWGTRRSEEHTSELQSPDHLVC